MASINLLDQQVLLAILRLRPRAYGVSIQERIKDVAGEEHSFGAIYAALERLDESGMVKSRQGEASPTRGGRAKLYFDITAKGQMGLEQSLRAVDSLRLHTKFAGALA